VNHDSRSLQYLVPADGTAASKSWKRDTPILDQGTVGSCFPAGTRVRMEDSSERHIEDVRLGERVVTAEGRTGRVVRTMMRDESDGLVRLLLWGHSHLRMTREHPVLTARGYVPASNLVVGDEVALPRYQANLSAQVVTADHVTKASHRVVRGNRWQGLPGRQGSDSTAHVLPEKIDLDEKFGRLIGLFLAEGSCDSGKAVFSFCDDETPTLVAETVRILGDYGVEANVRQIPVHRTCKVTIHGTAWTRLLASLCGNGAGLKRLHSDLTAGPSVFLAAVLSGWLDGDGCHRKDGSREGVTISGDLAMGMYDIAQSLGHHPVLVRSEPVMNSAAATRQPRWTLSMAPGQGRCHQDEGHVWRKVRETRFDSFVGPVYDLTVEGDHSYVAEGVGVHNCTGNATCGALGTDPFYETLTALIAGGLVLNEAEAVKIYSKATTLDSQPGSYPPDDTGSDGLSAAKAAQSFGLISGYQHITSVAAAQTAIQTGPFIVGSEWWTGMDNPDANGLVEATGTVRGGHEYLCTGYDATTDLWEHDNSWGTSYGVDGKFYYSSATFAKLLASQGDATVFVPLNQPAPTPTPVPTPTPTPTPDPGAASFLVSDPAVVARIQQVAGKESLTPDAWLTGHLKGYFHVE